MHCEITENHRRFQERKNLYLSLGYDMDAERDFILDTAGVPDGRILEVGTGKGYTSVALASRGHSIVSYDISAAEQRFALLNLAYRGLEKRVAFVLGEDPGLPFGAGSFGFVLSVNTLHHLDRPLVMLEEMTRVLAPGGKIVLSDFSDAGFELVDRVHRLDGRIHPRVGITVDQAAHRLGLSGFETRTASSRFQKVLIARRTLDREPGALSTSVSRIKS